MWCGMVLVVIAVVGEVLVLWFPLQNYTNVLVCKKECGIGGENIRRVGWCG